MASPRGEAVARRRLMRCDIAGTQSVGLDTAYIHSNIFPDYAPAIRATHTLMQMDMQKLRTLLEA